MKVKLFTHTDLDGVGCAVVMKTAFTNVDITYCDYNHVNEDVLRFLNSSNITDYDRIFITDISVNEEVAERLDLVFRAGISGVQLIDHHATALWLNKYNWAEVRVDETNLFPLSPEPPFNYSPREKVASSGTSLVYKFLKDKHLPNIAYENKPELKLFVDTVRKYDSWEWHNIYKEELPKELNDLLYLVGREAFLDRFTKNPVPYFNNSERLLLDTEKYRINKYIWKKKQEVKKVEWTVNGDDYLVAFVYGEQYHSQLGNEIALANEDVDFVAIIDIGSEKVSLRTVKDVDLSLIAKEYGGGGHPRASGFSTQRGIKECVMLDIIEKEVFSLWVQ